jgi:hypothetical protein
LLRQIPANRWTIATYCTRSLADVRLRAAVVAEGAVFILNNGADVSGEHNPLQRISVISGLGIENCRISGHHVFGRHLLAFTVSCVSNSFLFCRGMLAVVGPADRQLVANVAHLDRSRQKC